MGIVSCGVAVSLDGFVAGPRQSLEDPLGENGESLHTWMFDHPEAHAAQREELLSHGAYVMGRNMFGPVRGAWDEPWRGWWGEDPPYHAPVFVLTHYPRDPVVMEGGTTFIFITDGVAAAVEQAKAAAASGSVGVGGGASTINQCLAAGLIDELTLHVPPVLLSAGERLFAGVGDLELAIVRARSTPHVTSTTYRVVRQGPPRPPGQ
ncbi:dihydrofolate reductase [Arthrobacter frigidicola]|nr:dihydrofolate reductase [Arthrobacter frigidicola]